MFGAAKSNMGHATMTLSGWFIICRLGCAMINLQIKFEVSVSTQSPIVNIEKATQNITN